MEYKPLSSLVKKVSEKKEPARPIPHFPKDYKPREEEEYMDAPQYQGQEDVEGNDVFEQMPKPRGRPPMKQQQSRPVQYDRVYELVEVPTQTSMMIKNNATGEVMELNQVLVDIMNKLNDIDRSLRG